MASVLIAAAAVAAAAGRHQVRLRRNANTRGSSKYDANASLTARIRPPAGFLRSQVEVGDFADWLQRLPLKPAGTPVKLFDGRLSPNQDNHAAVIDIDVGTRDLMQCADAVIRLRAEYLYSVGRYGGDPLQLHQRRPGRLHPMGRRRQAGHQAARP